MNKDQVKGKVKEVAGKVQAEVGKLSGSREQQIKGHIREVEGKTQNVIGNANAVVSVLQKGYSIADRVLRPALVACRCASLK